MRIAVLSLQGAFIEHERMLRSLGADVFEVRELADWHQPKDGLVLPGGESTTRPSCSATSTSWTQSGPT